MARANRHFLPGYHLHITRRCHRKQFLFKFARDRRRYLYWLFEAKKRFGLCVLDYMITSNHVHLLVRDTCPHVIGQSMQLIAGRTAREYNERKNRHGAFWEDRYHATAIEAHEHLHRCLVYIDLNMVRAGVVKHPAAWKHSGYREIQKPPKRYAIIDRRELTALCGFADSGDFQAAHRQWVEQTIKDGGTVRNDHWSEAIAVGRLAFVESVKAELGSKAMHRTVDQADGVYALREPREAYARDFGGESEPLRLENTFLWDDNAEAAET
jgi:REP element-mobilizing transposase RayT